MDNRLKVLSEGYTAALARFLAQGEEAALEQAYEMGRTSAAEGLGLLNLAKVHRQAWEKLTPTLIQPGMQAKARESAEAFLLEALSPFEATHRGFRETNFKLRQLNEVLRRRNQELAVINRSLKNEVSERKRTEKALRESEDHYRVLFTEARQMQEALRNLSNQVLHVQEEERKRISRELHDEVGQALTAINIQLAALAKTRGKPDSRIQSKVADAQNLLQQTMSTVHRFARELRPAMLDDLGLLPALRSCVKAFAGRTSVRAYFKPCHGVEKLTDEQKLVLYRVTQESLTNVAKHAQATRVVVNLSQFKNGICLEIKDNGKAFSVDQQFGANGKKRLGLLGIQERVRLVHGIFTVESEPSKGTTIRVQIPLKQGLAKS